MRLGFWAVAALVFGALLAHFLLQDRGLVTISMRGWVVTMSVPALAMALIAGYFLVRFLLGLWRAPRRLGEHLADRRSRSAGKRLTRGLIHLSEGEWARSERLLTRSIDAGDAPLANYLMAARAAAQQGAIDRRNDWLRRAFEALPDAEQAILVTQAQLQIENAETEAAVAALQRVREKQPDNAVANALLARACRTLGDADGVLALSPVIANADLQPAERDALLTWALGEAAQRSGFDRTQLDALWQELPAELRRRPLLLGWHARAIATLGDTVAAERELRKAIDKQWNAQLVAAYGLLPSEDPGKALKQAEQWLKKHPEDAGLLTTAARLCMAAELWGKARSYLESSIATAPDAAAWALYGQLLNRLGETEAAGEAYRQGLSMTGGVDVDVPMLAADSKARS